MLNSTLEFEKCVLKRLWHAEITWPNYVTSIQRWLKAYVVIFESKAKSTLSNCMSLSHCKAWNKLRASSTAIEHMGEIDTVLASTKVPSSSRIHMLIPVLFNGSENEALTLHFRQPCCGRCDLTEDISLVVAKYLNHFVLPMLLSSSDHYELNLLKRCCN